jgi:hypothetical protein
MRAPLVIQLRISYDAPHHSRLLLLTMVFPKIVLLT